MERIIPTTKMISQKDLKEFLHYDPLTGVFIWSESFSPKRFRGKMAGHKESSGYVRIRLLGKRYSAHRLAFLYMTGDIPEVVDHINGDPSDNRWDNLRGCTFSQNSYNARKHKETKSGIKGVSWNTSTGKWKVTIRTSVGRLFLGYYKDLEEAELVVKSARDRHHKEFSNHGN